MFISCYNPLGNVAIPLRDTSIAKVHPIPSGHFERKVVTTGRDTGATTSEYGDYLMQTVEDPTLESRWEAHIRDQS